jgi:hypothetical protein
MIKAFSTILLLIAATVEARQRGYHIREQELISAEIERYTGNNNINGGRALRGDSEVLRDSSEDTSGKGKDKRTKKSKGSSDDSRKGKSGSKGMSGSKSKIGTKKGKGGNTDEDGDGGDSSGVVGFQFVSCFMIW